MPARIPGPDRRPCVWRGLDPRDLVFKTCILSVSTLLRSETAEARTSSKVHEVLGETENECKQKKSQIS